MRLIPPPLMPPVLKALCSLIVIAVGLVYLNSLRNPFVIDDKIILQNVAGLKSWRAGEFFDRSLVGKDLSVGYFRPLTLFTFAVNSSFAKGNPAGYRAVNIALHLAVVGLTIVFFSRMAGPSTALLAALLFGLHPAHVQAVSYISSRSELLFTMFALVSLIFWHMGFSGKRRGGRLWKCGALACFFFGLFAKETIVVLPAIVMIMDIVLVYRSISLRWLKERAGWYAGFGGLFTLYIALRLGAGFPLTMEKDAYVDLGVRSLLALKLFALHLGVIFYPARLSLFRTVAAPEAFFEFEVILGLGLMLLFLAIASWFWSSERHISFGALWFLISILPVLNLTQLNSPIMEHWLYFPLAGFAVAFVGIVRVIGERAGEQRGFVFGLCFLGELYTLLP